MYNYLKSHKQEIELFIVLVITNSNPIYSCFYFEILSLGTHSFEAAIHLKSLKPQSCFHKHNIYYFSGTDHVLLSEEPWRQSAVINCSAWQKSKLSTKIGFNTTPQTC